MVTVIIRRFAALAGGTCVLLLLSGQATSPGIEVKTIAEVQIKSYQGGHEIRQLVGANRVVPGDQVMYTLQIRNASRVPIVAPTVVEPIPAHMAYVMDSATGPGAGISFSADGGHSFDSPENLRIITSDHKTHMAKPTEYTHIQWKLKNDLKSESVAYARFRAVVK